MTKQPKDTSPYLTKAFPDFPDLAILRANLDSAHAEISKHEMGNYDPGTFPFSLEHLWSAVKWRPIRGAGFSILNIVELTEHLFPQATIVSGITMKGDGTEVRVVTIREKNFTKEGTVLASGSAFSSAAPVAYAQALIRCIHAWATARLTRAVADYAFEQKALAEKFAAMNDHLSTCVHDLCDRIDQYEAEESEEKPWVAFDEYGKFKEGVDSFIQATLAQKTASQVSAEVARAAFRMNYPHIAGAWDAFFTGDPWDPQVSSGHHTSFYPVGPDGQMDTSKGEAKEPRYSAENVNAITQAWRDKYNEAVKLAEQRRVDLDHTHKMLDSAEDEVEYLYGKNEVLLSANADLKAVKDKLVEENTRLYREWQNCYDEIQKESVVKLQQRIRVEVGAHHDTKKRLAQLEEERDRQAVTIQNCFNHQRKLEEERDRHAETVGNLFEMRFERLRAEKAAHHDTEQKLRFVAEENKRLKEIRASDNDYLTDNAEDIKAAVERVINFLRNTKG